MNYFSRHALSEDRAIEAWANAYETFASLANRLTDGFDLIWDEINGAKIIKVHGDKFCISEALVLAAFLPADERTVILDDVQYRLREYLYEVAKRDYYADRKEADEVAADSAYDAAREDRLLRSGGRG